MYSQAAELGEIHAAVPFAPFTDQLLFVGTPLSKAEPVTEMAKEAPKIDTPRIDPPQDVGPVEGPAKKSGRAKNV
jgi:hypothetical protein